MILKNEHSLVFRISPGKGQLKRRLQAGSKMQTEGKMQTVDGGLFNWIMLPFQSLGANRKQTNQSFIHANWSADFHYIKPK